MFITGYQLSAGTDPYYPPIVLGLILCLILALVLDAVVIAIGRGLTPWRQAAQS